MNKSSFVTAERWHFQTLLNGKSESFDFTTHWLLFFLILFCKKNLIIVQTNLVVLFTRFRALTNVISLLSLVNFF
jgi:hypothetical protein